MHRASYHVPEEFAQVGFHITKAEQADAPLIGELPMALERRLLRFSYNPLT